MKVGDAAETDVLRIVQSAAPIAESDEDKPGVILDCDAEVDIVGIEVLRASMCTDNPRRIRMLPAANAAAVAQRQNDRVRHGEMHMSCHASAVARGAAGC